MDHEYVYIVFVSPDDGESDEKTVHSVFLTHEHAEEEVHKLNANLNGMTAFYEEHPLYE